jgi:hypothetical protein
MTTSIRSGTSDCAVQLNGVDAITFTSSSATVAQPLTAPSATASGQVVNLGQADIRYSSSMPNFTASTTSNLISASLGAGKIDFRNAVLTTGTPIEYTITSALSLVMNSTAISLGATSGVSTTLIYAIVYAAGVPQLAVANTSGGLQLDETNLITTTTINSGSTSNNVWYSTSIISAASPYRIVGRVDATWTSGTGWSSPTLVQPVGVGEALAGLSSLGYGQTWKSVTRTAGTTYYNTTGKPIQVLVITSLTQDPNLSITLSGLALTNILTQMPSGASAQENSTFIVPPGGSYSVVNSNGTITWYELS